MAERRKGTEPASYSGIKDHGRHEHGSGDRDLRLISSPLWGDFPVRVNTENGEDVRSWNPDCSWYQYGLEHCMNGCQHPGMDIGLERETALHAIVGGTIAFAGWGDYYRPNHVDIIGDDGNYYIYGHMWSVDESLAVDGRVEAGQFIGVSGEETIAGTMEPDGTGAHLHFEVRQGGFDGCAIDPSPILTGGQAKVSESFVEGATVRVADGPLRLRAAAGTDGDIVSELPTDARLTIFGGPETADGDEWYRVRTADNSKGWVAGSFLESVGFAAKDRIRIADGPLRLRAAAGTDADIITELAEGTELCVTDGPEDAGGDRWYEVTPADGGAAGWVAGSFCTLVEAQGC